MPDTMDAVAIGRAYDDTSRGAMPVSPPGREAVAFTVGAVLFIALELSVLNAWILVTRPLWLDEIHTFLLAGTQSLRESVGSLAAGADFNPPTVFVLYRLVGHLTGGLGDVTMRLVATACVVGGMATIYLLLREQHTRSIAAFGAVAVWAQAVVVTAAFDARFYGPLLLGVGLMLIAVRRVSSSDAKRLDGLWLALASMFLCTVHYFGILSWLAAVATVLVTYRARLTRALRGMLPALAGPLTLAACIPLYIEQRAALTVPTWIAPVSLPVLLLLLVMALFPTSTSAAAICWLVERQRRRRRGLERLVPAGGLALGPTLLLSQALVPVTLAVMSILIQPMTHPRYWIAGALAAAPIVAVGMSHLGRGSARFIGAVTVLSSALAVHGARRSAEQHAQWVREDIDTAAHARASGELLVFRQRHSLYPVAHARPDLMDRAVLLDDSPVNPTSRFSLVERDVARAHRAQYGFPRIVTPADLAGEPSFLIVELNLNRAPTATEFPYHSISPVAPRVFSLRLR